MTLYHGMDRAALDAAYNSGAAVPNTAELIASFQARSDLVRAKNGRFLDMRYGPAARNRIDYFAAGSSGPVLAFIHGGYWQSRAKEIFSFVATGPLAHGIDVACIGYTLAPEITLGGIVSEVRAAIAWLAAHAGALGGDPERIYLSGWSAGGHLTALCLDQGEVRGGLAISGIFDLEPMRLSYLNDKLNLDADDVRALSPLFNLPKRSPPLIVACGGAELPELQRQSEAYAQARERAGLPGRLVKLSGHNHFTMLEELARPDGTLTTLVRELVA